MKQTLGKRILALLLSLVLLVSVVPFTRTIAATGTLSRNTATRHVVCDSLSAQAESYYTGDYTYDNLSQLGGVYAPNDSWATTQDNALYTALQTLMSSTHTTYCEYNPSGEKNYELSYLWDYTDASAGSSEYLYFYTDVTADDYGTSNMQREHVWPKSNASFYQENGGSDLHHLRPSIGTVNSAKSNYTFANVRENYSSYSTSSVDGNAVIWYLGSSSVLEVRDNIKGDVARILLYVYCRWGQPNLYTDVSSANLPELDSDDSANYGTRAIDDLDTLLEWMETDPVDEWEMSRNDQTENYQGNRNVFIDYPEFAWLMFGLTPPSSMSTPSGMAAGNGDAQTYTITAVSSNTDYGTVSLSGRIITATPNTGYEVSGYTVLSGNATVSQNGNVFTVSASSDCTIRINFSEIVYTVTATVNSSDYGSVSVDLYTITAIPNDGYQVSGYTLVSGSAKVTRSGNVFTVTPSTDCTVCINFASIGYSISAVSNNSSCGTVSLSGNIITAVPADGYEVSGYTIVSGTAAVTQNGNIFTVAPSSDCVIRINFSEITYTVTATVNSSTYGSVTVEDYTIIATPNSGYRVSGYTLISGSAAVTQEGNIFTVEPTSDCTIRINFASAIGCTVDFSVPQGIVQESISGYAQDVITLPTPSGSLAGTQYQYTFIGWTEAQTQSTTTAPTYYCAGDSYTITGNVTLYALYTYSVADTETAHYTLVNSVDELSVGESVVIVSADYPSAMSTTQNSSYRAAAAVTKDYSNDTISFTGSVCEFTMQEGSLDDTWAFYDSVNEGYLYAASSRSNSLQTQSAINDNASFTVSITDGSAIMTAQGSNTRNTIGFYSLFSEYFSCFTGSASSRGDVQLYKKTADDIIYYTTDPVITCEHTYEAVVSLSATCTTAGTTTYTCSLCGSSYTDSIDALGHNYTYTQTVAPTASEQGYDIYTCSRCGLEQKQNYTEPTGYDYTVHFSVPNGVTPIEDMLSNTLEGITLPTAEGTPVYDVSGAEFIGWIASSVDHTSGIDSYYTAGSTYTALSEITLYALYSYQLQGDTAVPFAIGSEGNFVLAALVNGVYYAIPSAITPTSGKLYGSAIEVTDGVVTDANAGNYALTFSTDDSATYSIGNGTYYLAYSGTSTQFASEITEPYLWTISEGTTGTWRVTATTGTTTRAIAYYNNSTTPCFAVYATSNLTSSSGSFYDMEILPVDGDTVTYYTTVFYNTCTHESTTTVTTDATCTLNGSVTVTCANCYEVIETVILSATGHSYGYTDNGEDHTIACAACGDCATESHTFTDGVCICGAVESTDPTYNSALSLTMNISVGAEMQVMYTILNSKVKNYDSFYVEVVKDVVGSDSVTTTFSINNSNLTEVATSAGTVVGYTATYTGIFAMEMGDNFTATLYAVDADGNVFYGDSVTASIKSYLMEKLSDSTSSDELKTLAVDMLNYGAAAQVNFAYDTENLVNADLTDEQKALGTQETPSATDSASASGDASKITTSVSLQSKVLLYVNCAYAKSDDSNLEFVVRNASTGEELERFAPTIAMAKICQGIYGNVGARQMRDLITVELYDNGVLVSQTLTWSIESYVAQVRADSSSSEALIATVNAMLTYGDSAAAYLTASGQ